MYNSIENEVISEFDILLIVAFFHYHVFSDPILKKTRTPPTAQQHPKFRKQGFHEKPFGSLLALFWLPSAPFWRPLVKLWRPLAPFQHPLGSILKLSVTLFNFSI